MADFAPGSYSSLHLLLIDDSVEELRLLVEILKGQEFRISIATDGQQGYQRAVASPPDLILLDMRMPHVDGIATARLLKSHPQTEHVPILFVTAAGDADKRLEGLRAGAVDYIVKPYSASELIERVRMHLQLVSLALRPRSTGQPDTDGMSEQQRLVREARKHLDEHLADPPRPAELASTLGVTVGRLAGAFQQRLGVTVPQYVRGERMRRAQRLLIQTGLSVDAIAQELGFSSAANFSTAFRAAVGETPSRFRSMVYAQSAKGGDTQKQAPQD